MPQRAGYGACDGYAAATDTNCTVTINNLLVLTEVLFLLNFGLWVHLMTLRGYFVITVP